MALLQPPVKIYNDQIQELLSNATAKIGVILKDVLNFNDINEINAIPRLLKRLEDYLPSPLFKDAFTVSAVGATSNSLLLTIIQEDESKLSSSVKTIKICLHDTRNEGNDEEVKETRLTSHAIITNWELRWFLYLQRLGLTPQLQKYYQDQLKDSYVARYKPALVNHAHYLYLSLNEIKLENRLDTWLLRLFNVEMSNEESDQWADAILRACAELVNFIFGSQIVNGFLVASNVFAVDQSHASLDQRLPPKTLAFQCLEAFTVGKMSHSVLEHNMDIMCLIGTAFVLAWKVPSGSRNLHTRVPPLLRKICQRFPSYLLDNMSFVIYGNDDWKATFKTWVQLMSQETVEGQKLQDLQETMQSTIDNARKLWTVDVLKQRDQIHNKLTNLPRRWGGVVDDKMPYPSSDAKLLNPDSKLSDSFIRQWIGLLNTPAYLPLTEPSIATDSSLIETGIIDATDVGSFVFKEKTSTLYYHHNSKMGIFAPGAQFMEDGEKFQPLHFPFQMLLFPFSDRDNIFRQCLSSLGHDDYNNDSHRRAGAWNKSINEALKRYQFSGVGEVMRDLLLKTLAAYLFLNSVSRVAFFPIGFYILNSWPQNPFALSNYTSSSDNLLLLLQEANKGTLNDCKLWRMSPLELLSCVYQLFYSANTLVKFLGVGLVQASRPLSNNDFGYVSSGPSKFIRYTLNNGRELLIPTFGKLWLWRRLDHFLLLGNNTDRTFPLMFDFFDKYYLGAPNAIESEHPLRVLPSPNDNESLDTFLQTASWNALFQTSGTLDPNSVLSFNETFSSVGLGEEGVIKLQGLVGIFDYRRLNIKKLVELYTPLSLAWLINKNHLLNQQITASNLEENLMEFLTTRMLICLLAIESDVIKPIVKEQLLLFLSKHSSIVKALLDALIKSSTHPNTNLKDALISDLVVLGTPDDAQFFLTLCQLWPLPEGVQGGLISYFSDDTGLYKRNAAQLAISIE